MEPSHTVHIDRDSQDTRGENRQVSPTEIDKLKNRIRAFTGAFVVMISPVLLALVLKKVKLAGAGKYQGIRRLEVFLEFVQGSFAHLAAATLQMGTLPFLCVMIYEACASLAPLRYVAPRLLAASQALVFVSNICLMALGCGILLLIHKEALLVFSLCSIMAMGVIAVHVIWYCCGAKSEDNPKYHSTLEHLLELSAGVTVMMFLVLECVALEGLLRNNSQQGQAGLAPAAATKEQAAETFLGATLIISFVTSAFGVLLMNVWTTPLVVSDSELMTTEFKRVLSVLLQALPITSVVILITLEVLPQAWKPAVWLPVFPSFLVLLVSLARDICGDTTAAGEAPSDSDETKGPKIPQDRKLSKEPVTSSASSDSDETQQPEEPDDQKPAPLELTKVAFTGFLAVAVPSVTNASVGIPSILFVFFTGAAVLLGLLWRLLTHEAKPSEAVLKAANHASFFAHTFIFLAGGAFWVMAAKSPNK